MEAITIIIIFIITILIIGMISLHYISTHYYHLLIRASGSIPRGRSLEVEDMPLLALSAGFSELDQP